MARLAGVRAVLFDAVGTLIRPEPSVAEVYFATGQRFGSRLSVGEIAARFPAAFSAADHGSADGLERPPTNQTAERRRWQAIVSTVLDDVPDAGGKPFEMLWQHFSQPCHWRLYDDAASTWQALEASRLILGIASNFDDRLVGVCRGLPPLDQCENIFWSARVGWPKPSPKFFIHIQKALGVAPREILLVGDDFENDYLGATAAGWQAVYVDRSDVSSHRASNRIRSLSELVERMKDEA